MPLFEPPPPPTTKGMQNFAGLFASLFNLYVNKCQNLLNAVQGRRPGRPATKVEEWETREKLSLVAAVLRHHQQKNW